MSKDPEPTQLDDAPESGAAESNASAASEDARRTSMEETAQNAEPEADDDEDEYEEEAGGQRFILTKAMQSWLVSVIVHMVAIIILTLIPIMAQEKTKRVLTVANADEEVLEELEELPEEPLELTETTDFEASPVSELVSADIPDEVTEVNVAEDVDAAAVHVDLVEFSENTAPKNDLMREIGALTGNGLDGRGAGNRGKMVSRYGGTKGSEEAVALALKWLAAHQMRDGGWAFNHAAHPGCAGKCNHPGSLNDSARNGATALALLPFLGAGQTHKEGDYKQNVQAGLYYLMTHQKPNGSFHEGGGSMYSHGLCAIVLCEAYAMTHDKALMIAAQKSINFIVAAQDPVGGGWRYQPKQPGDTSVVGWQLMALKSGHMGYLQVPPNVVLGASKFLDAVQVDSGSKYGYSGPGAGSSTTAVGLLCRMYLGWKKDHPALERGVQFLGSRGPSKTNMYYNYYATQVMKQTEGEPWKAWNAVMRDQLVNSQDKDGHQRGSWHIAGDHGSERGGRLYTTAMATMILEVYYRHMPIYGKAASEEEFPL